MESEFDTHPAASETGNQPPHMNSMLQNMDMQHMGVPGMNMLGMCMPGMGMPGMCMPGMTPEMLFHNFAQMHKMSQGGIPPSGTVDFKEEINTVLKT